MMLCSSGRRRRRYLITRSTFLNVIFILNSAHLTHNKMIAGMDRKSAAEGKEEEIHYFYTSSMDDAYQPDPYTLSIDSRNQNKVLIIPPMFNSQYDYYGRPSSLPAPVDFVDGWYGMVPLHHQRPPFHSKGKPIKGKPSTTTDYDEEGEDGWSEGTEQPDQPDKFTTLKNKWNKFLDKLKIKVKKEVEDKKTSAMVINNKSNHQIRIPSSSHHQMSSNKFQLENLPGWNVPPPRNPTTTANTAVGNGGGTGNLQSSSSLKPDKPPSSIWTSNPPSLLPPRRPNFEIWLRPFEK